MTYSNNKATVTINKQKLIILKMIHNVLLSLGDKVR